MDESWHAAGDIVRG